MNIYYSNYFNHLALVKKSFPKKPGEAQNIFRKMTVDLLDKFYFEIITKLEVNQFYELGAHEATASILFSKTGEAIAIEANPHTYKEKTIKAQKFGVQTYNLALGSKKSKVKLLIQKQKSNSGSTSVLAKVRNEQVSFKIIESTTIDIICSKHKAENSSIAFWVDVEGYSYEVLRGGNKTLRQKNVKLIKVELEEKRIWKNQKLSIDVDNLLCRYGFLPIFFDFEREYQHNCVYIRREYIPQIENLILRYFEELNDLKLNIFKYIFYMCRDFLHGKKNSESNSVLFHLIYFLLGSKSSKNNLKARIILKK